MAVIVGKRPSYCFPAHSFDDLKVFSVINAVVTLTSPVSASHLVYQTYFNLQNADPILGYPQFVSPFSGNSDSCLADESRIS